MNTEFARTDKKQKETQQYLDQRSRRDGRDHEGRQDGSSLQQRGTTISPKEGNNQTRIFMMTSLPADSSSSSSSLPLQHFWDAAEKNPNTTRFVLSAGHSQIIPESSSMGGRLLKAVMSSSDRKKDKATIAAFKAAVIQKYPDISWDDLWTHGGSKLGAAQIVACKKALAEHPAARDPLVSSREEIPSNSTSGGMTIPEKHFIVEEPVSHETKVPDKMEVHDEAKMHDEMKRSLDAISPDLRAVIRECRQGTLDWSSRISGEDRKIWDDAWEQMVSLLPMTEETQEAVKNAPIEIQLQHQERRSRETTEYLKFFKERFPQHEKYIDAKKLLEATICDQFLHAPRAREAWIDTAVEQGSAVAHEIMTQQQAQAPRLKNNIPFLQQAGNEIRDKVIVAAQKGAQKALSEDPTSFLEEVILPVAKEALLKNKDALELHQPIDFTIKSGVKEAFMAAMHEVMIEVVAGAIDRGLDVTQPAKRQSGIYRFSQTKEVKRNLTPVVHEALLETGRESISSEESGEDDPDSVWKDVGTDDEN
jgi:hypothetical protein